MDAGDAVVLDAPDVDASDAMSDALPPECAVDEDCDDGVDCTRQICDERRQCRNPVDPAICDDGVFCNGVEQCDPVDGCTAGPRETCSDDDVCTIDRCDEDEKLCRHSPRDFDEDGEADFRCEGGTDCDDRDPTRATSVAEICTDGVDNDCDEVIDEEECGRPDHDLCEDALDISAGGTFVVSSDGATADYSATCGGAGRKDLALTFTLTEPQDVSVSADGRSVTWVGLRTTCDDRMSEFECQSGFPAIARARSLEAGTYYALVFDLGGEIVIEAEFADPTPPATNETCDTPIDVGAGGVFTGSFVDVADDVRTDCGTGAAPDLTYSFTIADADGPQDVLVTAVSLTGETMSIAVRSDCADEATEVRCARGAPVGTRLHSLPAGTYTVIVEGPSFREVDFTLDVRFEAPTAAPDGDTCGNAIALALGDVTLGSLADKQDDHQTSCGFFYRDAVYSFEITERSDVTVEVDGGSFSNVSVRTDCADETSQLRCTSGRPARGRLRDLPPGTYYLIVESFSGMGFNISVTAAPPTVSMSVMGNDTCDEAVVVPEAGGLYTGNTTAMLNDYETSTCGSMARSNDATFELTLTSMRRVVASTEGSAFDTVLHLHDGSCMTGAETSCNDDGGDGSTSLIDRTFDPGTYFFVVDGFGTSSAGDYTFEVVVSDP